MGEYVEILDDEQAIVAQAAIDLQADALVEVLAACGDMPSESVLKMQRTLRILKATSADVEDCGELWLDESNVLPVCEAIWDVDQFASDCAMDSRHAAVASWIQHLGLVGMAISHRPERPERI